MKNLKRFTLGNGCALSCVQQCNSAEYCVQCAVVQSAAPPTLISPSLLQLLRQEGTNAKDFEIWCIFVFAFCIFTLHYSACALHFSVADGGPNAKVLSCGSFIKLHFLHSVVL